ncbi:hypothetical protein OG401_35880 [Kitasatospora purpeofusca]|uniref:hypothetical protein n=1 Tax=Kitasatospora purpeofusca TaxID=67352 RepID=UPI0022559139|nr:hypothetical protein [Kitasatospora purpeofusca]MCX4689612.1 hypothetical protein [Kitasatospora purpeofusca]
MTTADPGEDLADEVGLGPRDLAMGGLPYSVIIAPQANINTGSVRGGQHVANGGVLAHGRPEAHEGPIPAPEVQGACAGFAEPAWFGAALDELDGGLLFLHGAAGTGRRTAALNLLHRHSGSSTDLCALDGDVDLSAWRPAGTGVRGYLVHGLLPQYLPGPAVLANLRRLLRDADARMVVMLPHEPDRIRALARDLHVAPVRCDPPPPRAVFDARLRAAVPDPDRRAELLGRLEPGLLDSLLAPELLPFEVAELVTATAASGGDGPDPAELRERLNSLAKTDVPELLGPLRHDPEGLAFLLATCVFEGFDHRVVRDEADRLLALADGRLSDVLPNGGGAEREDPSRGGDRKQPNPDFVFRRSLDELLDAVRARCGPREIRRHNRVTYSLEPVRFTRHRQAETVLQHVWHQYGKLPGLLTEWLKAALLGDAELAGPVGQVMGLAAGWGGGRRALRHIEELASTDRASGRTAAAYALGVAARDTVLVIEVKSSLHRWSERNDWRLRSTVACACGTEFGLSRPGIALTLLRSAYRGAKGEEEKVARTVRLSLRSLSAAGNQPTVLRRIAEWAERPGVAAQLALDVLPELLNDDPEWFLAELRASGEGAALLTALVRRILDDDDRFDAVCRVLIGWCRVAGWVPALRSAVETLLTDLARDLGRGSLRLFVEIDNDEDPEIVGRAVAHYALTAWRRGDQQYHRAADHPNGGIS